ncbi:hypothetical protein KIN20_010258 [Parelaphostrongylus tenuis]|uniref:Mos1 transposase HTH domain-containing protein n=1 Tax=Parelaphostrongylus tenuis TaxID=148309 RepID=A0AAD5M9F1_PARTN|nr:hypothetical protein KIN20_010258 [Parelaphostrongylus tenuis]
MMARKWFAIFRGGENSLKDQLHSTRLREVDHVAALEMVEENPSLTCQMLAKEINICFKTIANLLYELDKNWNKSK